MPSKYDKYDKKSYLPPPSDHRVSLKQAAKLTRNYRESIPAADKTGFFHKQAIIDLLKQPGVVGMRYYHGLDNYGRYHLVLVGTDKEGRDIVELKGGTTKAVAAQGTTGGSSAKVQKSQVAPVPGQIMALAGAAGSAVILDTHYPCPPWCPPKSPLNA